ncbi:MAG: ABC transporter ATP-binding protein [Chloroflexota bacterium]
MIESIAGDTVVNAPARLAVRHVSKSYPRGSGRIEVLGDIDLELRAGEFVAIIGPSGCGKSTLLDILAGLSEADDGQVLVDGTGRAHRLGLTGYMQQKDLLLPWKRVLDNTAVALELRGTPRREAREQARAWFPRFGLEGFAHVYPSALSGGMRQRAALLRTFLAGRDVLLLDEPLASLDALTRAGMQEWLAGVRRDLGLTVLLVTHDVDEALYLADRVLVMTSRPGRIRDEIVVPTHSSRSYRQAVTSDEFARLKHRVLGELGGEIFS